MDEGSVGRRGILKAGAVAAGVAAGAVVASAATATRADAADGEAVLVGGDYESPSNATSFRITSSASTPAVSLANDRGPSLTLAPLKTDLTQPLAPGAIAGAVDGPLIGVADEDGVAYTTYLATGLDLDPLPIPFAVGPTRVLDTRTAAGRRRIVGQSAADSLDSSFRLRAGKWIEVAVEAADQTYTVDAAFLNVTVTGATANGVITAYPPGLRPNASTLNFRTGITQANGAFIRVAARGANFAVRLYTTATTHLVVDLTGLTISNVPGPAAPAAQASPQGKRVQRTGPTANRKTKSLRRAAQRY